MALLLLAVAAPPASAQANEPLRKTDLIRYLSGGTMTTTQIAQLVTRNCVSFTPTPRDRRNLIALGADTMILARIDACLRARTAAVPPPRPSRPTARPPDRPPGPPDRPNHQRLLHRLASRPSRSPPGSRPWWAAPPSSASR